MKRNKNDFEDGIHIDKSQVLQEAKQCFMATSAKTKKLVDVLTKCIYLILHGENLAPTEATDLFFHITRLFQYKDKDSTLRRLTYIGIKALSQQAENVYVVTSSLTTDVNSSRDDPAIRASALRALCQISDATTFTSFERYLKQSVVDRHPVVASAAIVSLTRIAQTNLDIVKRCTNEIQEALNSDSPMVQYHALGLRYLSCKGDKLAISRLISNCIQQGLKSPLATCLLIRIITNYINDYEGEDCKRYREYIVSNANHRYEMVEYEAANAIINLKANAQSKERRSAVAHLRNFLSSSKASLRFAAVRSLNRLAINSPNEVKDCNLDLENLISQSDCNRSIAILAITTLLKTGTKSSVEKFLKQIREFMSEIDDGFKIIVVGSVSSLCQKYPSKHPAMMDFLSTMLQEEGGLAYKKAIVDTITKMISEIDETKERGLERLCEFIEDCEHPSLSIEVLNLLGNEGPKTKKAATFIRFIVNRLLLDDSAVACAAITALAKFGTIPELTDTVKKVLARFSVDEDFEVMDRAQFYRNILSADNDFLNAKFITNVEMKVSPGDLEAKLLSYLKGDCSKPFDMSTVASANSADATLRPVPGSIQDVDEFEAEEADEGDKSQATKKAESAALPPLEVFDDIDLGELIKHTKPIPVTDAVSEFGVKCIKYFYERHIVLQFNCTNTVNDMVLEDVVIDLSAPAGFCVVASTECPRLDFEETAPIYVCVELIDDSQCSTATFRNLVLKYVATIDGEDKSEDSFPLEDLPLW